jgi:hypothetical protein
VNPDDVLWVLIGEVRGDSRPIEIRNEFLDDEEVPESVDQLLNCQPERGVALTVSEVPGFSEQPVGLGQFGLTEP